MMKKQTMLILALITLSGCGPLIIKYELTTNSSNPNEICCIEDCQQRIKVFSRTVHYQNGTNYLWIDVKSESTVKVELVKVLSEHFSYQQLESKSDINQGIYVFENTEKMKYKDLIEGMKNEEITLTVRVLNSLCNIITLKPTLN